MIQCKCKVNKPRPKFLRRAEFVFIFVRFGEAVQFCSLTSKITNHMPAYTKPLPHTVDCTDVIGYIDDIGCVDQFEKEEQVHSIDIGNEGSAFIEVLVGHSTSVKDQDFQVLLVTSSFMSPSESRGGTNSSRVRFFGPQQLVKSTCQEKWDRVKIVCTQPYNKNIQYGVAFIKFHSPPDGSDPPAASPPKLTKLGQFRVKEEPQATGLNLQPGSLFFNRENKDTGAVKVSPQKTKLSYAAAALQTDPSPSSPASSDSPQIGAAVKRKFEFTKERQDATAPSAKKQSTSPHSASPKVPKQTPPPTSSTSCSSKKVSSQKPTVKPHPPRLSEPTPFSQLMEGVVFVLSGFQNPFRGELRDKALSMGARYRPDWTPDCTHLICAFGNTPKYSQVKGAGGLIVRKEWVLDCHKRKQKISYKRYLMDGAESSSEEEEQSDPEEERGDKKSPHKIQNIHKKAPVKEEDEEPKDERDNDEDDDEDSGMDTEDELRRVEIKRSKRAVAEEEEGKAQEEMEADLYGGSTDENTDAEEEEEEKPIPDLPDFLSGKSFFLYGTFPENQRRLLQRYIIAFNGVLEEYMNEKVQFVITSQGWDDSFEDALMENEKLNFVKSSWIFDINTRQKLLPYQPYTVVP